jgi:ATP-dependent protease ClpP protease subunit
MDIFLLEDITQDSAARVIKDIHAADGKDVTLHIMSSGGSVLAGNAISAAMKTSKSKIDTNVLGLSASMASVISQAGSKRYISEGSHFNVHNAAAPTQGRGTKESHAESIEMLDQIDAQMMTAFKRTGLQDSELANIMKLDKMFTAEEAMTLGFFDEYTKPVEALHKLNNNLNTMSKFSELLGQIDVAAIKMGLKETDDEEKQALVDKLAEELKGQVDQIIETPAAAPGETGADILTSEMVSREEFELFKAEVLALVQPMLGAVEAVPTPEETVTVVEDVTTAKLDNLLKDIKSKTVAPVGKQHFEQPQESAKEDWGVYDARKKAIKETTGR